VDPRSQLLESLAIFLLRTKREKVSSMTSYPQRTRRARAAAALSVAALIATACAVDDNGDEAPEAAPDTEEAAPEGVATDIGVTDEPCPGSPNPDNGCIYLGVLSDLSEGPFAALAIPITDGQQAFWDRVNEAGGIGGYDVNISEYTRDTLYDPQEHSARYREIEPNILALAQTLGTETTEAILSDMNSDDVVGAPASWWSGWSFEESDSGLILESGYSYCIESQIGLDWVSANVTEPETVLAVGYPGDYGGDSAAGVEAWAGAAGVDFAGFVDTLPNAIVGSQDEAIGQVLGSGADVVVLAVGPAETAEIVGGSVANGFEGQFLGSVPTWNPALLGTAAAPALLASYLHISPWEGIDGESAGHDAMRESLDGGLPDNDGYIFGWVWSYPVKAALEAAAAGGDLTRAGLRSVVDGLQVDYEGMLPTATLGGDANANAVRTAVINRPDEDGTLGISTVEDGVTGPTADAYEYTSACS
jgi:ABC-type branched-subunit amino acid transport system substrate-binding protein